MKKIHLQWIGEHDAIEAKDLKPGMITVWNGGAKSRVLAVEFSKTGKTLTVTFESTEFNHPEKHCQRTFRATTLVAVDMDAELLETAVETVEPETNQDEPAETATSQTTAAQSETEEKNMKTEAIHTANTDETAVSEPAFPRFEVGAEYWETSAVDHECVMYIRITRRTEKSVWFVHTHNGKADGEPTRTKVHTDAHGEYITPYRYSMAPVWCASCKVEVARTDEPAVVTGPVDDEQTAPETVTGTEQTAPEMNMGDYLFADYADSKDREWYALDTVTDAAPEAATDTEQAAQKTETRIDIAAFYEKYVEEYGFCYENRDNVAGFDEAAEAYRAFIKDEPNAAFMREFCTYMEDYITSDREAAAFMFALEDMTAPSMAVEPAAVMDEPEAVTDTKRNAPEVTERRAAENTNHIEMMYVLLRQWLKT